MAQPSLDNRLNAAPRPWIRNSQTPPKSELRYSKPSSGNSQTLPKSELRYRKNGLVCSSLTPPPQARQRGRRIICKRVSYWFCLAGVVLDCSLDSLRGGLPGCHPGLACRLASLGTTTGKASRRVKGLHPAMYFFEMSLLSPQSALLERPLRVQRFTGCDPRARDLECQQLFERHRDRDSVLSVLLLVLP